MKNAQALPPLTSDLIEAYAASAVVWLVRLLGIVLDPSAARRRRRLARFVRWIERCVEAILFLRAVHAFGPPPQRRRIPRPAPVGFRRTRRKPQRVWTIARIRASRRASFADRIAQLLHALANPAPYVARFTRQLCKGLRLTGLVAAAPPAQSLAADAPRALAYEDTS